MIRLLALFATCILAAAASAEAFDRPVSLIVSGAFGLALGVFWDDIWPRKRDNENVEYVDLSGLSREANLPEGYIVLWVETQMRKDTHEIVGCKAMIGSLRESKRYEGNGATIEAAIQHAAMRARFAGAK
jgi:hypothetical protein